MKRRAAFLLLILSVSARAQDCVPVNGIGCFRDKPGSETLLVYFRGHLTRPMEVPPIRGADWMTRSARDAVDQYDLAAAADDLNAAMLVIGSSYRGLTRLELAQATRRPFSTLFVAAHSGGNVGLADSLPSWGWVDGVVLLDCFYGVEDGRLDALSAEVRRRLSARPMLCGGFTTPHNEARHRTFAAGLGDQGGKCRVDALPNGHHEAALDRKIVSALAVRRAMLAALAD